MWCSRQDHDYTYRPLQDQYTLRIFSSRQELDKMLARPSIPARMPPRHAREHKTLCVRFVLSTGIEPVLAAPQAAVLSVERRERD